MTPIVRFAPSPTGYMHLGNARPALLNWLFCKKHDGKYFLRFDDTDAQRSRQQFADAFQEDLHWLGISPDVIVHQSARTDLYDDVADQLRASGLLYPCYETSEELLRRRKQLLSRNLPPIYGRDALKLSADDREALEADGRKPHWRFLLPNHDGDPFARQQTIVEWDDLICGRQSIDLSSLSDPVLVREDGTYLYTLPSVADDADLGITHVIRGDDHITNTAVQLSLFAALDKSPPVFGHHNLLMDAAGEGLSKRKGSMSIRSFREDGFEPGAIASLAATTGTSKGVRAGSSLEALAEEFDLSEITRSPARFDSSEIVVLNRRIVHSLSYGQVEDRLSEMGVTAQKAEAFWYAVRDNCDRVEDAQKWWKIVENGPDDHGLDDEDLSYVTTAYQHLPDEEFDETSWAKWTGDVKASTGRKGKELFMPLRMVLTGQTSGPELAHLLPLIGRERTLARRP